MLVNKPIKFALTGLIFVACNFPSIARAEWYFIGDGEEGSIYLNDQSVYIKNDLRSAEVKYPGFGRAVFVINCDTYDYYLQSNYGESKNYATPGTVAGVIADEVCDNYTTTE